MSSLFWEHPDHIHLEASQSCPQETAASVGNQLPFTFPVLKLATFACGGHSVETSVHTLRLVSYLDKSSLECITVVLFVVNLLYSKHLIVFMLNPSCNCIL